MIKIKGLGRITELVETPGGLVRAVTMTVVADEIVFEVVVETQDPDTDFRAAAALGENLDVEVSG